MGPVARRSPSIDACPRRHARLAGWLYLAIIVLGLFGEVYVRGSLVTSDPATTLRNIASAEALWRLSIATDLLMHALDVPVIVIFYLLLRPVSPWLAAVATLFNVVQTAVLAANKLTLIVPLVSLSTLHAAPSAADAGFRQLLHVAVSLHSHGFAVGLAFFGVACLVRGHLMFRSGYFPKWLGLLLGAAGSSYLVNSVTLLLAPSLASALFPAILLPALVGEVAVCGWLIVEGVDLQAWHRRVFPVEPSP